MTVVRRADGTLLAGFSVHQDGVIGCGARVVTSTDPDYEELSVVAISEIEWAAAADPDHPDNVRASAYLRARHQAEAVRDFAVRLDDGRLLLPEQYWWEPHLLFTIGRDHPDYRRWAATAVPDARWHRSWWRGPLPGGR
ncbi:hypothetical protein [Actinomadura sp. K4S16]|uniref:hypothetical protein n=1 Tax=Actinomadura sp. K4S16 TaxID=1316147 RepID=UPI0011ED9433|nr:hypothetical protein [Actinomadura sp. K4S16]